MNNTGVMYSQKIDYGGIGEDYIKSYISICEVMVKAEMTKSNGEGRRLIKQGAVRIDGEKISDVDYQLKAGDKVLLQVGKRRVKRIKIT